MLRQVYIIKDYKIIYTRTYANALNEEEIEDVIYKIRKDAYKPLGKADSYYDYYKFRVSYHVDKKFNIIFIFVTGLMDDFYGQIRSELFNLKGEFFNLFPDIVKAEKLDESKLEAIDPILDMTHRNLKPKISIVGFSGVGKTTIKQLIKMDKIPLEHIPTITADVATIKIGKLFFNLWDFAGQDEFGFLWKKFLKGSDSVLLVTDSTPANVEKSTYFVNLIKEQVPLAHFAIIANKQDLAGAMDPKDVGEKYGFITHPMVANKKENRGKMMNIIAELLDMRIEDSPLVGPLIIKDQLIKELDNALNDKDYDQAIIFYNKLSTLCSNELGDDELGTKYLVKRVELQKKLAHEKELERAMEIVSQQEMPLKLNEDQGISSMDEVKEVKAEVNTEQATLEQLEKARKEKSVNIVGRLLGMIKAKKRIKITYLEKFLKIDSDEIVGIIFDLIGNNQLEGEFNEDDTEFIVSS